MTAHKIVICWIVGHRWRYTGYVLSYLSGGRDYTERCFRCGRERRWHPEAGYRGPSV